MEWGKLVLLIGGMLIVTVVVIGGGGYLFVRILASTLNSRRDSWEGSAHDLGFVVDRSAAAVYKPFSGERAGRKVTVSHFAVPRGEHSADDYAAVEVSILPSLTFSFKIEKPEMLQIIAGLLGTDGPETGHDIFDKVFRVSSLNMPSLNAMLNVEMLDGQSPTLLTDLLLATKRFYRVKVNERSVTIGVKADFSRSDLIAPAIDRAVYLAERVEEASRKISPITKQT
jgi:hypothetical protein